MLKLDNADLERMRSIENVVAQAIVPYRESQTEALLVVFALLRVARLLFRQYSPKTQKSLVPVITAFFEGQAERFEDSSGDLSKLLVIPS